jgi:serine protease Do
MASMKSGFVLGVAAAGLAAAALAGGGVRWSPAGDPAHHLPLTRISSASIFAPPPGAPLSFADIFERVSPAVVSIDVTSHLDARSLRQIPGLEGMPFGLPPGGGDDQDDGDDNGGGDNSAAPPGKGAPKGPKAQSSGSGFFISADGYIVTNNHVVENAEDIKVTLTDGRELPAKVIGRDEDTDLAVLKVQGAGFPYVDFENSAKPRVGDWVLAVGNPYGLNGTATAGIVSAYGRNIGDNFVDFIQIDAPINRGNSGGPTFDIYGRVIGVNSAIFSPSGGSVGIGFAIPADVCDTITKQLINGGKITRGYLGATIQDVTPEIADSMGMTGKKGALVADLVAGGPAQKAGVMPGDVVIALNGDAVGSATELTRLVARQHPGQVLHLSVLRNGKPKTVDVMSGTRPPPSELAASRGGGDSGGPAAPEGAHAEHPTTLGLTLGAVDAATRGHLGLPSELHGAVVLAVKGSSDAADKGLKAGDIIIRAGDADVASPADVVAAVARAKAAKRASILLGIHRDGVNRFAPIKLED